MANMDHIIPAYPSSLRLTKIRGVLQKPQCKIIVTYIYILTSHHVTSNHLTSHYITLDHATSRETKLHRMIYDICVSTYMYCHIQIRMSYVYIIEVLWFQTWLYEAPPSSAGKVESQRCSHWTIVAVCHGATDGENDCLFV